MIYCENHDIVSMFDRGIIKNEQKSYVQIILVCGHSSTDRAPLINEEYIFIVRGGCKFESCCLHHLRYAVM